MLPFLLAALCAAEPAQRPLTYADALRQALSSNPELLSARAGVDAARAALVSARGAFDPLLELTAGGNRGEDESNSGYGDVSSRWRYLDWDLSLSQFAPTGTTLSLDWQGQHSYSYYRIHNADWELENESDTVSSRLTATLTQSLLQGFRTTYNLQGVLNARRELDAAQASLAEKRLDVAARAPRAYWKLYAAQEREAAARKALAVAEEEARVVDALVEAGRLAPVERSRVAAQVEQARGDLLDAENARADASDALAALLGLDPGSGLEAVSRPAEPVPLSLDPERVLEQALRDNPSLLRAEAELQQAELALEAARHARLPELSATGTVSTGGYDETFSAALSEMLRAELPQWYLGGTLSVPLGNRADRGAWLQARAALEQARQAREGLRREVQAQVRSQLRAVSSGAQRLQYARAALEAARETLEAERARRDAGRALQKDVLEAEKAVADAEVAVIEARTAYAQALVELGRLQGHLEGVAD